MILAIDPSFTGCGCSLLKDGKFETIKINPDIRVRTDISKLHLACRKICIELKQFIDKNCGDSSFDVVCEYPALQTRSGAELAILNGYITRMFEQDNRVSSLIWLPPMACDSWIHNRAHKKSFIVAYCKGKYDLKKRISNDECTAIVLTEILQAIRVGEYKNSYFVEDLSLYESDPKIDWLP